MTTPGGWPSCWPRCCRAGTASTSASVFTPSTPASPSAGRSAASCGRDAAHIMPVWQGQGYNTGMRDATNLAWKLAYVVNGLGSDALLETYQSERPPTPRR